MTNQEFIEKIAGYVQKYAKAYGILVHSPIIAQAILESGWGKSKLASTYHNYFGLKCGSKWTGKSVNMKTNEEYQPGVITSITDNFRVYDSMEEGVKGYFEFIQLSRYHNLRGITDPKKYLETIKVDGYATSSTYVTNCYALVTQYNLTQYDSKESEGVNMGKSRSAVVNLVNSWDGKNEADGSHKMIIDIYNSYLPHPRGYKLKYNDAWCAGTVSALAIKLGYTDIIPVECSCYYMIQLAKSMGIWIENDGHIPKLAEFVLYDWDDSGKGDNTGNPDHIGTVIEVNASQGWFKVKEGNYSNAVKTRTMYINGKYIRGFISPKYDSTGTVTPPSSGKSVAEVAREVLAGTWGNNPERKEALTAAGYNYDEVQKAVNNLLKGQPITPVKSVAVIAQEVIDGKWGNGNSRKQKLESAGYNYDEVQKKVNAILKAASVTAIAKEVLAGKWGNGADRKAKLTAAGYDYDTVQAKVNELIKGS